MQRFVKLAGRRVRVTMPPYAPKNSLLIAQKAVLPSSIEADYMVYDSYSQQSHFVLNHQPPQFSMQNLDDFRDKDLLNAAIMEMNQILTQINPTNIERIIYNSDGSYTLQPRIKGIYLRVRDWNYEEIICYDVSSSTICAYRELSPDEVDIVYRGREVWQNAEDDKIIGIVFNLRNREFSYEY